MSCGKFFRRFFQKATAHPTRGALVAARTRRNISCGVFFFAKLFSLRLYCQRKKRVIDLERLCVERGTPHLCGSPLPSLRLVIHPSVALWKGKGVSPSAEGDRRSRRLRRAFEKARAKLPADTAMAFLTPRKIKIWTTLCTNIAFLSKRWYNKTKTTHNCLFRCNTITNQVVFYEKSSNLRRR